MAEGEKTRVLIVDDIAETRENIRKLLQFETDIEVIGVARTGREAIQMTQETSPDVVLMDINMPDMDGITATEAIRQKIPHVKVVILSVQSEQNYMRRAMLVGASDFLTKPPMADELTSAIRRAGSMAREERAKSAQVMSAPVGIKAQSVSKGTLSLGKIIMVYSPKGGVGSTTVAVNLALALHNEETRVALVDANMQFGDVAVFLNEQGKNTVMDLAPRADELEPDVVEDVMIKHPSTGLHVLAAPSRPEQAENITADQFEKILLYLRQLYAYIIVDTSTYLTDVTLTVMDVSDIVVVLTTQDIPSIKNCRLYLDLLVTLGISQEKITFVMNRYDKRIAITPEKIGENLKQEVVAVIPLDERAAIPAVARGVPFVLDNKNQPAARGIFTLAEVLRSKLIETENITIENLR
jgi:pilus assembly protein CpaE